MCNYNFGLELLATIFFLIAVIIVKCVETFYGYKEKEVGNDFVCFFRCGHLMNDDKVLKRYLLCRL